MSARLYCTSCFALIDVGLSASSASMTCPACGTNVQYWLFPAISLPAGSDAAASYAAASYAAGSPAPAAEGEASCFNHPTRKAVVVCSSCGRFLCSLCDIDVTGRHQCPACFEKKRTANAIPLLQTTFTRHDRVALALTIFPALLCCWPALLTAPIALFVALRHWNSPGSDQTRVKRGLVVSVVLAAGTLLLLGLLAYTIFTPWPVSPPAVPGPVEFD